MEENKDCAPGCTNEISSKDLYRAYFVDLNDDGVNEIIGIVAHSTYWGTAGYCVFILKNEKGEYVELDNQHSHDFQRPIKVLIHKTNNYHDLTISPPRFFDDKLKEYTMQYSGKYYGIGYIIEFDK